jgi:hypothetical protein
MPRNSVRLITVFATTVTLLAAPQALTSRSDVTRADAGAPSVTAPSGRTVGGPGNTESISASSAPVGSTSAVNGLPPADGAVAGQTAPAAPATDTATRRSGGHRSADSAPEGAVSAAAADAAPTVAGLDATTVGFNWPNAVAVYVNHWDQQTVTHADRSRPFRVASAHGVTIMRTFLGTVDSFRATRSPDPAVREATWRDLRSLLDDAAAEGVQLILSNYLTEEAVETLADRQYRSWPEARRALVTEGSPPWLAFRQWMDEATTRFAGHPAALSWEVMNEPGWMLGIDDGTVGHDPAAVFLDTFQGRYQRAGVTVNAGGRPKYDTTLLSDDQVRLMTRHVDVLDDHLYPEGGSAEAMLDAVGAYRDRVLRLTGRALPVVLGEIGTQPESFFTAVMAGAEERGFGRVVWGFDAYDGNAFSDVARQHVLQTIAAANRR